MEEDRSNSDEYDANSKEYSLLQQSQKIRTTIQNISELLNTGLDNQTLDLCVKLCEAGVHPQALAEVVQQIRAEVEKLKNNET